jgi:hypothetical protein
MGSGTGSGCSGRSLDRRFFAVGEAEVILITQDLRWCMVESLRVTDPIEVRLMSA